MTRYKIDLVDGEIRAERLDEVECRLAFDKMLSGTISAAEFDDAMDQYIRIAYEN